MEHIFFYIILAFINFILGSIPTSYIIVRSLKGIDIREHGSCNPGATNTYRVAGAKAGITTLIIDILKGAAAVFIVKYAHNSFLAMEFYIQCLLIIFVVFGHTFSVFLKFKGGKGVAAAAGVFLGLVPTAFTFTFILFFITVYLTRYISLGSILSAISLPFFIYFFETMNEKTDLIFLSAIISAIVIIRHSQNIKRLLNGQENKFGQRRDEK